MTVSQVVSRASGVRELVFRFAGTRVAVTKKLELFLWFTAASSFSVLLIAYYAASRAQVAAEDVARNAASRYSGSAEVPLTASTVNNRQAHAGSPGRVVSGDVIGQLNIPALHLSVPITAGTDDGSLVKGVGHVDGTAVPGGLGTMALAGHRDTYLHSLKNIAQGADIAVIDLLGTHHYSVDSWEIVTPDDVDVLSTRSRPELVLITCYPFRYIGTAPKRFVVHAHLVSVTGD